MNSNKYIIHIILNHTITTTHFHYVYQQNIEAPQS